MTNSPINLIDSTLVVKASGCDATADLLLPEGKSIAQLLYDQETQKNIVEKKDDQNDSTKWC